MNKRGLNFLLFLKNQKIYTGTCAGIASQCNYTSRNTGNQVQSATSHKL